MRISNPSSRRGMVESRSSALVCGIPLARYNTGLEFDNTYLNKNSNGNHLGEIYESRSALYTASRAYPFQRLIGQVEVPGSFLRNWIKRRNRPKENCEYVNEMIHWSAAKRFDKPTKENGEERLYKPANLKAAIEANVRIYPPEKDN